MKYLYLIFFTINIISISNNQKKKFIPKSNYILVFKEYPIDLNLLNFINNNSIELKNLFIFIFFLKDKIIFQILKAFLDNKYYILYENNGIAPKPLKDLNEFLMENINYIGYEDFLKIYYKTLENNEYIQYKICILNNKNTLPENYLSISMDKLIENYCIFKFITSNKKILINCVNCRKKEIQNYLKSMKNNEKKLFYLKSHGRYVILERLSNNSIGETLSEENLKYLYIKYGFSLYYNFLNNRKLFENEILKFIHEIYCD